MQIFSLNVNKFGWGGKELEKNYSNVKEKNCPNTKQ